MTPTTIDQRAELARHTSDGIEIALFWNRPGGSVMISVRDERTGEGFELELDGRDALDAFHHPFAYAARRIVGPSATLAA